MSSSPPVPIEPPEPGRPSAELRSAPSAGTLSSAARLSPKLLEDAAKRLAWLPLIMAALVVIVESAQQVAQPQLGPILRDPVTRLVTLGAVLMAVALFVLQRFRLVTASTLVGLAMVFEVIVAFAISIVETAIPLDPLHPRVGISSLGPWVVLVGIVVPNRPMWTLVTALAAATTWPAAYAINALRLHFAPVPLGLLIVWPMINYLLAGLAFFIGRKFYGTALAAERAQELGSYRLVSPIGQGGMGEVWKATHQMLARTAAIKLVRIDALKTSAREAELFARRFRREANVIAGLQSPHTVYLFDFGFSRDGRPYYVMELLDGINLQKLIATFGPQPAERVAHIARQICRSLDEAHAQGLVHRDLKPSNVMVCRVATTYDFVKVLDFGLAKAMTRDDVSQLTAEGIATGTPGYMAPEVAMGESRIDARADLYALGCLVYFLLTATLVFHDPNPMSMALKHVQMEPEPPSRRTELPIPPELEQLVMRCLAKSPDARPSSAREIAAILDRIPGPAWTDDEAARWWERHLPPTSSLRSFAQTETSTPRVIQKA